VRVPTVDRDNCVPAYEGKHGLRERIDSLSHLRERDGVSIAVRHPHLKSEPVFMPVRVASRFCFVAALCRFGVTRSKGRRGLAYGGFLVAFSRTLSSTHEA